jgi:hypothetical protein
LEPGCFLTIRIEATWLGKRGWWRQKNYSTKSTPLLAFNWRLKVHRGAPQQAMEKLERTTVMNNEMYTPLLYHMEWFTNENIE